MNYTLPVRRLAQDGRAVAQRVRAGHRVTLTLKGRPTAHIEPVTDTTEANTPTAQTARLAALDRVVGSLRSVKPVAPLTRKDITETAADGLAAKGLAPLADASVRST